MNGHSKQDNMNHQSTRRNLIDATKQLIWQQGFAAMSPRTILERSCAGQGSLYHHFKGKSDLAKTALKEMDGEMKAELDRLFAGTKNPIEKIKNYLTAPRTGVKGCRLGRLANDTAINDENLRIPVADYFSYVEKHITDALDEAGKQGLIKTDINARGLAVALVAVVQGGYVLSRVHQDNEKMKQATGAALELLQEKIKG